MEIEIYQTGTQFGYFFANGPCMHRKSHFNSYAEALAAAEQDRAETLAYAHRFEPRLITSWDNISELDPKAKASFITGWGYKCACGLTIPMEATIKLLDGRDEGPCSAAIASMPAPVDYNYKEFYAEV